MQNADGGGARVLNVHLPWSDGSIYFGTGSGATADTRINRSEPNAANYKGRWNHCLFLKDGLRREIWQNGVLWMRSDGGAPLATFRGFWIGSANGGGINYPGKIDGLTAFAEHALGTSDTDARAGRGAVTAAGGPGTIDAVFTHRLAADDALLTPELSTDLAAWQSGPAVFTLISDTPQAGGIALATWRAALPRGAPRAFIRVWPAPGF